MGTTADQRFMGLRGNGQSVKELTVFDLRQPLHISAASGEVELRWPFIMDGWTLESSLNLGPGSWSPWTPTPSRVGDYLQMITPATPPSRFFRLKEASW